MKIRKEIVAGAIILLLLSCIGAGIYYNNNRLLSDDLNNEKLRSEMLLAERLAIQKEVESFRFDIASLSGKNKELDNMLADAGKKLNEKENEIFNEKGKNAKMRKHLNELNQMKSDFESKVLSLTDNINKMDREKNLQDQIIASLKEENKKLADHNHLLTSMTADNYLVQTTRARERLTVKARKARKMSLSFKVPENITENISFKLTKPDGTKIEGKENGLTYTIGKDNDALLASIGMDQKITTKKIEMTYLPKDKLKPGVYKIEMFNGGKYMGSCNVKLR